MSGQPEPAGVLADAGWDSFFDPRSVCVVGASGDPSRIGGRLVRYSVESGFTGRIIPVNPHRERIFDLPAIPDLTTLDESPDWVVVAVPSERVAAVVTQAGEVGARNVAVVAAGFAEVGEEGRRRQQELVEIARRYRLRLLGPNSNGFMNVPSGGFFAFTPVIDSARPVPGELAIVTQSAALGTYLLNYCRTTGLGVRNWVHTGNEAGTTLLEVARALADRGQVKAVALCVEVLRDLPALRQTLTALGDAGIAVGVLHAGTSPAGKRASQAHTAALIGAESALLADLFADAGAYPAGSIGQLASFLQVAVTFPGLPAAPRLGLVTTSGGVGVLAADAFTADRLPLPTLSAGLQRQIRSYAPFSHPANPVDTTAQVINQPDAMPRIISDCLDSGELDLVAVFVAHGLAGPGDRTLRQLTQLAQQRAGGDGPALAAVGVLSPEAAGAVQRCGIAAFPEPAVLSAALRAYLDSAVRRAGFLGRDRGVGSGGPGGGPPDRTGDRRDEWSAKQLLRERGAPVVAGRLVDSADAAVAAAEQLGYPVVLKVSSAALPHKASVGGLRLHLWTPEAVRDAYRTLAGLLGDLPGPGRLLLEKQETGAELFVGCVRHEALGLLVGIGPGGSGVEQSGEVRWHWGPLAEADVRACSAGAAGPVSPESAGAIAGIVDAMAGLVTVTGGGAAGRAGDGTAAGVALSPAPHTVEVNPVIVTDDGRAVVVDALIVWGEPR